MPGDRVVRARGAGRLVALMLFLIVPALAGGQQRQSAPDPQRAGQAANPQEAAKVRQQGQPAQMERQVTQPLNNAPLWRDVRGGDVNAYQTTQVRGPETNVLIQSEG